MGESSAGIKLLAGLVGFWLVMRAVNRDASGRTLIDHLLGQSGGANQLLPGVSGAPGLPSAAAANAATGASTGLAASGQRIMAQISNRMGWGQAGLQAWEGVESHEDSSYSLTAKNPTSNAYGEAQFINGPGEYAQYGGNAATQAGQLTAMANYIKQRYGTPQAALQHELTYNWY